LLLMGSPGSGKTYGIIHRSSVSTLRKEWMYVYDFKYPSLTMVTYNALIRHQKKLPEKMKFYCINLMIPVSRIEVIRFIPAICRRYACDETSRMTLMNLNRKWIEKQGEYFVESPINYVAALIWFLRTYDKGQ
jgi:hypothetical protein